jgi:DNA-binding transcriptional LysR family regulator
MWTMQKLDDLLLFVQAAESGSFAAAARRLGCPKSTVSKRVAVLEARLGARLVQRTSRSFVLTDIGREVLEHARAAMLAVEAAENTVRMRRAEPSGVVRITASVPTAQMELAARLPLLAIAFPKLQIQLHVTDRFVDLLQEGFDIAVRSHFAPLPDSDLVARELRRDPFVLVASPDYLAAKGAPATPEALIGHDGLLARPDATVWRLHGPDGQKIEVEPRPRFFADESTALLAAAKAGLGITVLPQNFTVAATSAGRLTHVLPAWHAGTVTTSLLTTSRRGQLPAIRAVVGFLCGQQVPGETNRV